MTTRKLSAALLTLAAVGLGAVGCATQDPLGTVSAGPSASPSPSPTASPYATHPPTPTVKQHKGTTKRQPAPTPPT